MKTCDGSCSFYQIQWCMLILDLLYANLLNETVKKIVRFHFAMCAFQESSALSLTTEDLHVQNADHRRRTKLRGYKTVCLRLQVLDLKKMEEFYCFRTKCQGFVPACMHDRELRQTLKSGPVFFKVRRPIWLSGT